MLQIFAVFIANENACYKRNELEYNCPCVLCYLCTLVDHFDIQVAIPDVKDAVEGADVLVFVIPHQFVDGVCKQLVGKVKEGAIAVSLIKVGSSLITSGIYTCNECI